ncbi:aspartyl-phosphate phosphatase Spo0E family protein [Peribacillus simplex]|uniref:aspartyl-phosphate phosphatase Spo0E family protein n=1 Tax=Peribacillus simplex TaxID=1478 RepID=UPI0036713D4A
MRLIGIDELESRINQLKNELIQIDEVTGLNSPETIYWSQILDQYITSFQKFSYKKAKSV